MRGGCRMPVCFMRFFTWDLESSFKYKTIQVSKAGERFWQTAAWLGLRALHTNPWSKEAAHRTPPSSQPQHDFLLSVLSPCPETAAPSPLGGAVVERIGKGKLSQNCPSTPLGSQVQERLALGNRQSMKLSDLEMRIREGYGGKAGQFISQKRG